MLSVAAEAGPGADSRSGPLNLMTFLGLALVGIGGYYVWVARAVRGS